MSSKTAELLRAQRINDLLKDLNLELPIDLQNRSWAIGSSGGNTYTIAPQHPYGEVQVMDAKFQGTFPNKVSAELTTEAARLCAVQIIGVLGTHTGWRPVSHLSELNVTMAVNAEAIKKEYPTGIDLRYFAREALLVLRAAWEQEKEDAGNIAVSAQGANYLTDDAVIQIGAVVNVR